MNGVEYIPVWSAQLEHDGACPGLSCYQGGSQLLGAMTRTLDVPREAGRIRGRDRYPRQCQGRKNPLDQTIREHLGKGHTYSAIARELDISETPVRRVAQEMRRHDHGQAERREGMK